MVIIEKDEYQVDRYVIVIPERGIRQAFRPATAGEPPRPFVSQAEAEQYEAELVAGLAAADAQAAADAAAAEQARKEADIRVEVTASAADVQLGTPITITLTVKDGLNATVNYAGSRLVPIEDEAGVTEVLAKFTFAAGVANKAITFGSSGFKRISAAGFNRYGSPSVRLTGANGASLANGIAELPVWE